MTKNGYTQTVTNYLTTIDPKYSSQNKKLF